MKVFVTGATGFIGIPVIKELRAAGHDVIGLTRSEAGAKALEAAGAVAHYGELTNLESLRSGAAMADAVLHLAFIHDFSKFEENCAIDKRAIEALGSALSGSDRPLIVTSGMGGLGTGKVVTEDFELPPDYPFPRVSEQTALALEGVNASVMRLPQVHDTTKQGLVTMAIAIAREKGVSAYVGDGLNRWPAVHVLDTARLYRLALEKGAPGMRYHAVAEEGVTVRSVAEAIGRGLGIPVQSISADEASSHFGWLGTFFNLDMPASSALTQERLGWHPTGPGLIADLDQMDYA